MFILLTAWPLKADVCLLSGLSNYSCEPIVISPRIWLNDGTTHIAVDAVEYTEFLKEEAVTDELGLYHQNMGSDPETACIVRTGSPGSYSYALIAGREEMSVGYLTKQSAEKYFRWRLQQQGSTRTQAEASLMENENFISFPKDIDESFACNIMGFYDVDFDQNTLSFADSFTNIAKQHPYIDAASGIIFIALAIIAHKNFSSCCLRDPEHLSPPTTPACWAITKSVSQPNYVTDMTDGKNNVQLFQAGQDLLNELTQEMISDVKKPVEETGFTPMKRDIDRSTTFTLHHETFTSPVKLQPSSDCTDEDREKKLASSIEEFKNFIGDEDLSRTIASFMHQKLFASIQNVIRRIPRSEGNEFSANGLESYLEGLAQKKPKTKTFFSITKDSEESPPVFFLEASTRRESNCFHRDNIDTQSHNLEEFFLIRYKISTTIDSLECLDFHVQYNLEDLHQKDSL